MEPPAKISKFGKPSPEEIPQSSLHSTADYSISESRNVSMCSKNAQEVGTTGNKCNDLAVAGSSHNTTNSVVIPHSLHFTANSTVYSENAQTDITGFNSGKITVAGNLNTTINSVVNQLPAEKKAVTPFRISCPAPVPNFVGREDLLLQMHSLFKSCATKTEWRERTVIIHGLGGMGKSELARKYVQLHIKDPIIQNVAWIDSEKKSSLEESFKNIARKFDLKTEKLDTKKIAADVYEYFSENFEAGLFIFDNAEQLQGIWNYLPIFQHEKLPLILITSRTSDWEASQGEKNAIGIPELDQDQAVELLINKLDLDKEQKKDYLSIERAAQKLHQFIQGLPLAIILAASYIRDRKSGKVAEEVEKYIKRFEDQKSGWIKDEHSRGLGGNYKLVMDTVWKATFDEIESRGDEGKCALTLLNIMAYLPTDHLRKSRVDEILDFGYPSLKEYSAAGYTYLQTFSLASKTDGFDCGEKSEIRIHRLVQRCTRERLKDAGENSFLVKIGWFLCQKAQTEEYTMRVIHRHLKKRNWPENSFRISIIFLSLHWTSSFTSFGLELARDLYEAIADDGHAYVDSLAQGYSTLLGMLLYIVSEKSVDPDWNEDDDEATATLRRVWNDKYKETFKEAVKIFTSSLTSKDVGLGSEVQKIILDVIEDLLQRHVSYKGCCIKVRDSVIEALNEVTFKFTLEDFEISKIYAALGVFDSNELNTNSALGLSATLKLHLQCYTNEISLFKKFYWSLTNGPIPYRDLCSELKKSQLGRMYPDSATPWEKSMVDALLAHSGLQVVQQHLCFDDGFRRLGQNNNFVEFILRLITVYNCSKAFKETPSFLQTLREKATTAVKFRNSLLLVWLTLFPPNHEFKDEDGATWSLNCIAEVIETFVEDWKNFRMIWELNDVRLDEDALMSCLLPHFEFDGHSLRFKNALSGMVTLWSENSTGATGKFTHVLDDVWKATFEELKSEGAPGECALTLLNIVAFLPNERNEILKSQVNKILEFGYSQHKNCINQGLRCLQSFSLIIIRDELAHVKFFVPQQLQRYCRQCLDDIGDLSDVLNIWRYLCHNQSNPDTDLLHYIYGHLKERNWPINAIQPSILFLSRNLNYNAVHYDDERFHLVLELATYLSKVLDDDKYSHCPLLEDGYRTLLGLSLNIFSNYQYNNLSRNKNNPLTLVMGWKRKYANALDKSIEIFTNYLMPRDSLCSSTVCSEVLKRITGVFASLMDKTDACIKIRIKIRDSVLEALNRTTITAQHSDAISTIYKALNAYDPDELNKKAALGLKAALELHFQLFLNCNSFALENQDYWTNGPIRYWHLHCALRKSKEQRMTLSAASEWEKSIVNAFIAHEGPKVVQQHLSCSVGSGFILFVTFLVTEHNYCAENFKQTPSFLHSLKENTSRANVHSKEDYLLLWLALFPPEDTEGRKWLMSMAEEMKTFLKYHSNNVKTCTPPWFDFLYNCHVDYHLDNDTVIRALLPHLNVFESSGQEDLIFKTAVALMDGDIRTRKDKRTSTEGWETLFRCHFDTPDSTRQEVLEVGKTHGFI